MFHLLGHSVKNNQDANQVLFCKTKIKTGLDTRFSQTLPVNWHNDQYICARLPKVVRLFSAERPPPGRDTNLAYTRHVPDEASRRVSHLRSQFSDTDGALAPKTDTGITRRHTLHVSGRTLSGEKFRHPKIPKWPLYPLQRRQLLPDWAAGNRKVTVVMLGHFEIWTKQFGCYVVSWGILGILGISRYHIRRPS